VLGVSVLVDVVLIEIPEIESTLLPGSFTSWASVGREQSIVALSWNVTEASTVESETDIHLFSWKTFIKEEINSCVNVKILDSLCKLWLIWI